MCVLATTSPKLVETLRNWFVQAPEMLILVRYRSGAGSRDFELHRSLPSLEESLARLPAGASVTAFRDPQLPHRGVVDDAFIDLALRIVADGSEYLIVEDDPTFEGPFSRYHYRIGESHAELRDDLEESRGVRVAFGHHPLWLDVGAHVIDAFVPDQDGVVRPGAY